MTTEEERLVTQYRNEEREEKEERHTEKQPTHHRQDRQHRHNRHNRHNGQERGSHTFNRNEVGAFGSAALPFARKKRKKRKKKKSHTRASIPGSDLANFQYNKGKEWDVPVGYNRPWEDSGANTNNNQMEGVMLKQQYKNSNNKPKHDLKSFENFFASKVHVSSSLYTSGGGGGTEAAGVTHHSTTKAPSSLQLLHQEDLLEEKKPVVVESTPH